MLINSGIFSIILFFLLIVISKKLIEHDSGKRNLKIKTLLMNNL